MNFFQPDLILLDLDNTVYAYESAHQKALVFSTLFLSQTLNVSEKEIRNRYYESRQRVHQRLKGQASSHNRLIYFQDLLEQYVHSNRYQIALEAYEKYWTTFIDSIELFKGVIDFLEKVKNRHIPVVIVTDLTTDVQLKKIDRLGLDRYIQSVVTSEEAGVEKPSKGIFLLAIEKAGSISKNIWMIGDDFEKDIQGARSIEAIGFLKVDEKNSDNTSLGADYVFSHFEELVSILEQCGNGKV